MKRSIQMMSLMLFLLVGVFAFSGYVSANPNPRPDINISLEGGKVPSGAPIFIYNTYKDGVDKTIYTINNGKKIESEGGIVTLYAPKEVGTHFSLFVRAECNTIGHKTWAWKIFHYEVVADNKPPIISVSPFPTSTMFLGDQIILVGFDYSGIKKIQYYWDNDAATIVNEDSIAFITVPEPSYEVVKIHTLYVYMEDYSGNVTNLEKFEYTVVPEYQGQNVLDKMIKGEQV